MSIQAGTRELRLGQHLIGLPNCPYCGVASPVMIAVWQSASPVMGQSGQPGAMWGAYFCTTCGNIVLAKGKTGVAAGNVLVESLAPAAPSAHEDLPETARRYLDQAFQTLAAPDAAAIMAGSAVDAMLKTLGYEKGSVYERINAALQRGELTAGMAEWAHSVRLGSNRPRHADKETPHVSPAEARQSVEFAEALGNFLFVLTARIKRGIAAAEEAASSK